MTRSIPRWIHLVFLALTVVALVPPVIIARARVTKSSNPRLHPIPDMDNQRRYKAQMVNPMYADRRANRMPVIGTVARGELREDDHFERGYTLQEDGTIAYFNSFPAQIDVNERTLRRGRQRFEIYCAPCHGYAGGGNGMVPQRAKTISEGYTEPYDLIHDTRGEVPPTQRELGHIFNTITNGIRTMPAYQFQIPVVDRWAIVAYVRLLQKSESVALEDLPADVRANSAEWPVWTPTTPQAEPTGEQPK